MPLRELDHFLVLTDDVEGTRAFYERALGLEAGDRPPLPFAGRWLYSGGAPRVHVAERASYAAHAATMGIDVAGAASASGGPVDHIAFVADDYDEVAGRLDRAGVDAVPNEIPAAGIRQLFLEDPNGVRIEVNVTTGGGVP
jgi:catechol 2,3-dioxygenase-like lactoylglutathione lyase family enzyme